MLGKMSFANCANGFRNWKASWLLWLTTGWRRTGRTEAARWLTKQGDRIVRAALWIAPWLKG